LRQSEARLITVLDTTVEGILTVTPAGLIETPNVAASRMFGRRPDQLEGLPAETFIRAAEGTQNPGLLSHLTQSADTPGDVKRTEFVGINREGETFPLDISVGKTRNGEAHYTCVLRDMTEQRKTEEQLRHNEQRLKQQETELLHMQRLITVGELAAMMAHEINQPLGATVNYLGATLPVIMFTGHGGVPMAVQTLKYAAFDFLEKPASHQVILDRVQAALALDKRLRHNLARRTEMEQRIQQLIPREGEILNRLLKGHSTREMALSLKISDRTVEKHRERLIVKLGAKNQLDLVRRIVEHRNRN
jgi:PAS domain S-box-containing protein